MGTAFVITSVDNATCAGKEDSSASRKDQEDRACATPISSGCAIQVRVDFRHRAKQERQNKKLMANQNMKAGKAKTKLMMDSKQESLDESKKVRRTSLVSLL